MSGSHPACNRRAPLEYTTGGRLAGPAPHHPDRPLRNTLTMKTLILTVLAVSFLVIPLRAQTTSSLLQAYGGLNRSIAPEEAADYYPTGFMVGFSGIRVLASEYGLEADVSFTMTPLDAGRLLDDLGLGGLNVQVKGGGMSILSASVGLRYQFSIESPNIPYVHAQGGIRRVSFSEGTVTGGGITTPFETDSETKPGLLVGVGSQFPVADGLNLFAEINYDVIFTDDDPTQFIPVKFGIVFALD